MDFINTILSPIQIILAWIMNIWHEGLVLVGMPRGSGTAWILAIMLMTVTIKVCLLPLLLKQIHATRRMQGLQPQLQAIQKKYKGKKDQDSKMKMSQETMALYKAHNANPASSCLPMLFQGPILFSLYWMLRDLGQISTGAKDAFGPIDATAANDIENSWFFGAKLSQVLSSPDITTAGQVTIWCVIAFMCVAMFLSQNLNIRVNMPEASKDNPQFKSQKIMAMVFPLMYIFMGQAIPMGVLVYWIISNFWQLGQTVFQILYIPTPGSKAADWKETRDEKSNLKKGILPPEPEIIPAAQRVQPVGKSRAKKK
jgi:YidC/Oxa1 family membrane protein insertase